MSHGIRVEDIAWQAFLAGTAKASPNLDFNRVSFLLWWNQRTEQGCALPACEKCGHDPGAVVAKTWAMTFTLTVRSGNAHVYNVGTSRFQYGKDRNAWAWALRAERLRLRIPKATKPRRVTLCRFYNARGREFDHDNLTTGAKPIIDAMVREGLLVGDEPANVEVTYRQERGKTAGVAITLMELA